MSNIHYTKIALGGTFDHLHIGHRAFFTFAFEHAEHVVIGVTLSELTHHKSYASTVEQYEVRVQEIQSFFEEQHYGERYTIIPLSDVYGTTLTDATIEAVFVTPMTEHGAKKINEQRQKMELSPLPIHICKMVKDEDGEYVSSSRIREGCIDREGCVYRNTLSHDLYINEKQKTLIRNIPSQSIFSEDLIYENWRTVPAAVVVGDATTQTFLKQNIPFSVAYVDGFTKHEHISLPAHVKTLPFAHPAGILQQKTLDHVRAHATSKQEIYAVDGEEDLIALEAILALPLGSIIVFGNPFPPEGIGIFTVNESLKNNVKDFITSSAFVQQA